MRQRDTTWPEPPNRSRTGLRLATLDMPFATTASLPEEGEATGVLAKVRIVGPHRATFALRHTFISSDIGLPGAGIPLEGGILVHEDRARVAVYTSTLWAAFVAFVWGGMLLIGVSMVAQQPGVWNVVWLAFLLAMLSWWYRRAKAAIPRVVSDALQALERLSLTGRTDPWR